MPLLVIESVMLPPVILHHVDRWGEDHQLGQTVAHAGSDGALAVRDRGREHHRQRNRATVLQERQAPRQLVLERHGRRLPHPYGLKNSLMSGAVAASPGNELMPSPLRISRKVL